MITEILSIITVVVVIAHLILDIIKERRIKRLDDEKIRIEKTKANASLLSAAKDMPSTLDSLVQLYKDPKILQDLITSAISFNKTIQKE